MLTSTDILKSIRSGAQFGEEDRDFSRRRLMKTFIPNSEVARKRINWLNFKNNLEQLKAYTDTRLQIHNSNESGRCVDPVDGTRAKDPVYRKISRAMKYAHRSDYSNPYWSIAGSIHAKVNDLQIKLERREMKKPEYDYLKNSSVKKLLEDWSVEINIRLSKSSILNH
jgi:hypothetical protein